MCVSYFFKEHVCCHQHLTNPTNNTYHPELQSYLVIIKPDHPLKNLTPKPDQCFGFSSPGHAPIPSNAFPLAPVIDVIINPEDALLLEYAHINSSVWVGALSCVARHYTRHLPGNGS